MNIEIVGGTDVIPGAVISLAAVKEKRAKAKKKTPPARRKKVEPTPAQLFAKDVEAMGECTDHLYAASRGMTTAQQIHWRSRLQIVLQALQNLKDDTAEFVPDEGEAE